MGQATKNNFETLLKCSQTETAVDITFRDREPIIDVTFSKELDAALSYGAGHEKVTDILSRIKLSNGSTIRFSDIWTINAMPRGTLTEEKLAAVDLSKGDDPIDDSGLTLRKIVRDTYHCSNSEIEDKYLRRVLAS
ncbi:hypothetical protein WKI13_09170 [Teredinibacter turnerae]|uniref:hypothetical protein n=1 Tax=Teredinibacter turnerae TaxID=2426 RepID=UPI000378DE8F|nr:hypothetical protein [Teredinibacter turnerae]